MAEYALLESLDISLPAEAMESLAANRRLLLKHWARLTDDKAQRQQ